MSLPLPLLVSLAPEARAQPASTGREIRRLFPVLVWSVVALGVLGVISLVGLALDPRELTGAPIWLKPFKFSISGALYAATLAVLLRPLAGRKLARVVGVSVGGILVFETVLISVQAARGVTSHFNISTDFDAMVYSSMGIAIATLSVLTLIAAIALVRTPAADPVMKRAAVWGLALSLAGGSVGYLMTQPTADQLAGMQHAPPEVVGAHTVGALDGGPGMRLTNWSIASGDLRVAHFWGLHGLQAIPLLALFLGGLALSPRQRRRLVHISAMVYGGVFAILLWQALRGQSVLAPDALTLVAAGAVLLLTAFSTVLIFRAR